MAGDSMILSEPDDTHLTLFNPDEKLLGLIKTLASSELGWFTREELRELPMGKIDRMIAKKLTADSR